MDELIVEEDKSTFIEKSYPLVKIEGKGEQKTLYFSYLTGAAIKPGQFFMLNYNLMQKPFSVSHYDPASGLLGFTIAKRGEATEKMIEARAGEYFGLTGPAGNSFDIEDKKSFLLIGGGVGSAPIFYLASYLAGLEGERTIRVLLGARTDSLHDFSKGLSDLPGVQVSYYTDDGSGGKKGFVTQDLEALLSGSSFDTCCICGPEKMMSIAAQLASPFISSVQLSIERYMKCGIGLCGSCVLDNLGTRVCREGTVFEYSRLTESAEFGKYHRDSGGVIEQI